MKVLIIGDIIIDKYIYGSSTRLSPEAPVPIVAQERIVETMGGAGLVYENLKSLGVDVDLYDHGEARSIKTRVICDGHYVTRIDNDQFANGTDVLDKILNDDFSQYKYVVLSDYNKGVLDESKQIIKHLNTFGCKVIVDPKEHANHYEGAWLVKPNNKEFGDFGFADWKSNIITTNAGENVIALIDDVVYDVPVERVEVSDVTGAGDCFLAAFVYSLTKEYDYKKCLELAVRGSTESVKHSGTYILTVKDLKNTKIFTNGCFDILHRGHIEMLKASKALGDYLVVGLNTDKSVSNLKGPNRPINNEADRKVLLESLGFVDEVILFDEDTPLELIKKIKPDIITKGGDYTTDAVVGNELTEVIIIPTVENFSTTNTIKRINNDTA
jgi:D-beta-D-heptose 7-phosphate kinase / D-beta-D-heptose 1-phosphate adenosyltransferase